MEEWREKRLLERMKAAQAGGKTEKRVVKTTKRKPKVTMKMRAFASKAIELKNPTAAAREVFDCKNPASAGVIASRLMNNIEIKKIVNKAFKKEDINIEYVLENIKKFIDSTDTTSSPQEKQIATVNLKTLMEYIKEFPSAKTEPIYFQCSNVACDTCSLWKKYGKELSGMPIPIEAVRKKEHETNQILVDKIETTDEDGWDRRIGQPEMKVEDIEPQIAVAGGVELSNGQ